MSGRRSRLVFPVLAAVGLGSVVWAPAPAEARSGPGGPGGPGLVSNIKVLSDKVPDVLSIEACLESFIRPGMSDREKGLAIWEAVVRFRHQDAPPNEFLQHAENVHDPVKTFNVYGYGMCCCASSNIEALARAAGLEARGLGINRHSVPEVRWDGDWHLLDASLINYFLDAGGDLASVDEIVASVKDWYDRNPGYKGDDGKLRQFMRNGGWRKGPAVLATSTHYGPNGWLPAATHGWYSTMQEYDGSSNFVYEYGYSQGYRANVRLREGERLVRNWSNKGLHVNMDFGGPPGCIGKKVGESDLRYMPAHGDIAPGRVGNGERVYEVPLAGGRYRAGAWKVENIRDTRRGPMPARRGGGPGVIVLRMPSAYVYLGGEAKGSATVGRGGSIKVSLSRNNGLDWKEIASVDSSGDFQIDLKPHAYRLYDYLLRFELDGGGTTLSELAIRHDVQHSQAPLPALGQGANTITFSAGPANENTVTVEGCTKPETKGNQLLASEFHPVFEGATITPHGIRVGGTGRGSVTFPVETPGDIVRLRFGTHYRARDKRDGWDYLVSFDDGASWTKAGRAAGPFAGRGEYITVNDVPKGRRKALVRFDGQQRNTTCIFDFRMDADYVEPEGGFRPVKITYAWEENGQEKRHEHVARHAKETYTLRCGAKPVMKSIVLELAE